MSITEVEQEKIVDQPDSNSFPFYSFPKIARWSRPILITEKIDGTNASIFIGENGEFLTGSRSRWITPVDDNFGFSRWAHDNKEELLTLGPGHHFGEWWGKGIQRGYDQGYKIFSLFNATRWGTGGEVRPKCCEVVPVLWKGMLSTETIESSLDILRRGGSVAAPGFMNPEGIIIWHEAARLYFKKTIKDDNGHKRCN